MPGEALFLKKFQSNNIKFLLEKKVVEERKQSLRKELTARLCEELGYHQKKVTRMLNNTDRPSLDMLVAASQLLGVSVDELITLAEPAVVHQNE